jgi:hypothetical protein
MFVRTLPQRGVPPRGSVQDRVACEMLSRERRMTLYKSIYLGRILSATSLLPEPVFQLWTELFATQVYHESYMPSTIEVKKQALKGLESALRPDSEDRIQMFKKLQKLEAREENLRPATSDEVEEIRRRLRRQRLNRVKK